MLEVERWRRLVYYHHSFHLANLTWQSTTRLLRRLFLTQLPYSRRISFQMPMHIGSHNSESFLDEKQFNQSTSYEHLDRAYHFFWTPSGDAFRFRLTVGVVTIALILVGRYRPIWRSCNQGTSTGATVSRTWAISGATFGVSPLSPIIPTRGRCKAVLNIALAPFGRVINRIAAWEGLLRDAVATNSGKCESITGLISDRATKTTASGLASTDLLL